MPPLASTEIRIMLVQGRAVVLDLDLARLHRVSVRELRDMARSRYENFPGDFCFQPEFELCPSSVEALRRYVFTEPGVWMVAAVLNTAAAFLLTIEISRAFERFRRADRRATLPLVSARGRPAPNEGEML